MTYDEGLKVLITAFRSAAFQEAGGEDFDENATVRALRRKLLMADIDRDEVARFCEHAMTVSVIRRALNVSDDVFDDNGLCSGCGTHMMLSAYMLRVLTSHDNAGEGVQAVMAILQSVVQLDGRGKMKHVVVPEDELDDDLFDMPDPETPTRH